eukprot:CAMPEP_0197028852 /NCGR_PEP_ID=MMETSP1384-20130603/8442_1 /TAXON_ID=29189 /ORGANISM="Ammonia sp." /LENGTH=430 /DNA_ID=CAMNT_0042457917 /DNA_START=104 /DNA_END=1396 /DNA_ORIENTATION=+
MGGICGGDPSEATVRAKSASAGGGLADEEDLKLTDQESAKRAAPPFEWVGNKPVCEFTFNIQTPPLVRGNELIFLYTKKQRTKYVIFDLNTGQISKKAVIQGTDEKFDVFNTVYALHEEQQRIYFIESNERLFVLDLNDADNELKPLNKSITTSDNNVASIAFVNQKLYILGGEEKSDLDDNYELVPYSTAVKFISADRKAQRIDGFGSFATVMKVHKDDSDWIYVIGGLHETEKGYMGPNDQMFRYVLTNCDAYTDDPHAVDKQRWQGSYFVQPANRFGLINYNNEYLVSFGGFMFMNKKIENRLDSVFVLALTDSAKCEKDSWYELARRLPLKGHYHAVYSQDSGLVHLFTYDGFYYQLNIQDVIKEVTGYETIKDEDDEEHKVPVGLEHGAVFKHGWLHQGKPLLPEKTKSIKNLEPKGGDDDSDEE